MPAATQSIGPKILRSLKRVPRNTLTLLRMICIDCAVPILFLFGTDFLAQLLGALVKTVVGTWSFGPVVAHRIGHTVTTAIGGGSLLYIALVRLHPILRSFHPARSMIAAMGIGIFLLAVNLAAQIGVRDIGIEFSISAGLMVFGICIFTPICEEMFFRGYLWARLQARGYSEVSIMICTAVLFAAVHAPDNLASLFNYLRMGFSFSLIRYFSGGIGLPIFFHAAMNFIVIRHIGL